MMIVGVRKCSPYRHNGTGGLVTATDSKSAPQAAGELSANYQGSTPACQSSLVQFLGKLGGRRDGTSAQISIVQRNPTPKMVMIYLKAVFMTRLLPGFFAYLAAL